MLTLCSVVLAGPGLHTGGQGSRLFAVTLLSFTVRLRGFQGPLNSCWLQKGKEHEDHFGVFRVLTLSPHTYDPLYLLPKKDKLKAPFRNYINFKAQVYGYHRVLFIRLDTANEIKLEKNLHLYREKELLDHSNSCRSLAE